MAFAAAADLPGFLAGGADAAGGADLVRPIAAGLKMNFCAPIAASIIIPPSDETKIIAPES